MKTHKTLTAFFLAGMMFLSPLFPCAAAYAGEAETRDASCYDALSEEYIIHDKYAVNLLTDDIAYFPDYGEMFTDGTADDGYAYDEEGRQINSLTYISDRYGSLDSERIDFDSTAQLSCFMNYIMAYVNQRLGISYYFAERPDGNPYIMRYQIENATQPPDGRYYDYVKDIANRVDGKQPLVKQAGDVIDILHERISYDIDSKYVTLTESLQTGKGVCYYYARITYDVLCELSVRSELILGDYDGAQHLWLRYKDDDGRWVYADPCFGENGLYMARYLSHYVQYTVH